MNRLLPSKPTVEDNHRKPQFISLEDEETDSIMSALSTSVARDVLAELHRNPAPQSELADRVGTSIQNVDYHLENLVAAGLVEVVDQWYSEKGREMNVYVPLNGPIVLAPESHRQSDGTPQTVDSETIANASRLSD